MNRGNKMKIKSFFNSIKENSRENIIKKHIFNLTDKKDYALCSSCMDAQTALNELCRHFLGDDFYIAMPESPAQVNTEIVYYIESLYRGDSKAFKNLKEKYKKPIDKK